MSQSDLESARWMQGKAPVADTFASALDTDVINMRDHSECYFTIHCGVGTTGTSTITVESCDDTTPTTATTIAFQYKRITGGTDAEGDWTAATTAGFVTTANASSEDIYVVKVLSEELSGTDQYVRLSSDEKTDGAVLAGVLVQLSGSRYADRGGRRTETA